MTPALKDALAPGSSIAQVRSALAECFRAAGVESPELDARLLTGHTLGLDQTGLVIAAERKLSDGQSRLLSALAARRLEREPVARILGSKEFWGLNLRITPATLVPRPETETVVEEALAAIDHGGRRTRALRIADLGTGSGALLLALLSELPNAFGVGTDISRDALITARGNAERHGLQARACFVVCNLGAALGGNFDLVVCNPPYVASDDIAALPPEVQHDPKRALDGGTDGLACYRALAGQAHDLLAPGGHLVVELGAGQEAAVTRLLRLSDLTTSPARADLAGIPRALHTRVATKTP